MNLGKLKKKELSTYIIYTLVLAGSFLASFLLPIDEIFKGFVAIPGIGALILGLREAN